MKRFFLYLSLLLAFIQPATSQVTQPAFAGVYVVPQTSMQTEAAAFITAVEAAGTSLDATQEGAINTLVVDLKAAGVWTKTYVLYPLIGGTASSHSYNLKDPSSFQITWGGSPTHSATGVDFNGSSQYGNTGFDPSVYLTVNDTHLSYYSRDNTNTGIDDIGVYKSTAPASIFRLIIKDASNNLYSDQYNSTQRISGANANSQGFYVSTRTSSTDFKVYRNATQFGSNTGTNTTALTSGGGVYIGALNQIGVGPINYGTKECAFVSVGSGLTSTEVSAFNTAVANFQTTLSR